MMLVGLRGVGKTVLLDQMMRDALASGNLLPIRIEAPENRSLPALLAPQLRLALLRLSNIEAAKDYAIRGLRALAGFASKLKVTYSDIEVGLDYPSEPGLADNGDLEGDLTALLEQVGHAAKAANALVAIFIDELQYVEEHQMAALISALHRCAQLQLPVTVIGAGLPQLRGRMGEAKSYAERLFDFPSIAALSAEDARDAIEKRSGTKARRSRKQPSISSSSTRTVIRTFCRSGASTRGTSRQTVQSLNQMSKMRQRLLLPR